MTEEAIKVLIDLLENERKHLSRDDLRELLADSRQRELADSS